MLPRLSVNKEMAQNHILSAIDVEQKMKLFENVEATALRNTGWLCEEYSLRFSLKKKKNFSLKTPNIKFTMRVAKMQIYWKQVFHGSRAQEIRV